LEAKVIRVHHPDLDMEELVATGIAGLVGLFVAVIAILFGIVFILGMVQAAFVSGNTERILIVCGIPVILAAAYVGTGLWLKKIDRI